MNQKNDPIDFAAINQIAKELSKLLFRKEPQLIEVLTQYETYKTAKDEIERAYDLLTSLEENKDYFVKHTGPVAVFMPCNQPLYSFACFAIVPSLMAERVFVKAPESMKLFYEDMLRVLEIDTVLPNIELAKDSRENFLLRCSATKMRHETNEREPVVDVVIFTGTTKNADMLRKRFHRKTLFIANGSGHNPLVVTETGDIHKAVESIMRVKTYNQGQDCAAPNAILIHKDVYETVRNLIRQKVKALKVGDYKSSATDIGPISRYETIPAIQEFLTKNSNFIDETTAGIIKAREHVVEPTIINKPLSTGGNFTEVYAPIFILQSYGSDDDLAMYFEDSQYENNAMYITVYGKSKYIENLINKPGKILHDSSTIIYNTDLHAPGIERGVNPYGGYGRGASCLSFGGRIKSCPTLPQRDIYDYIICRPNERNAVKERSPDHRQQVSAKTPQANIGAEHWGEQLANRILQQFPDREVYTTAAGISPSGTVHFGNFRDLFTAFVAFESLKQKGLRSRLIFSWDDFDRFRKVPKNVNPSFAKYIGLPYTEVPCPDGKYSSYAERFEKEFEEAMDAMGIYPEYLYQSQLYKSGIYDKPIIQSLREREKIADILLSFMPEKTKVAKSINPDEYKEHFYPVILYSRFTGKDNTKIINYDGDSTITYKCFDTDKTDIVDITKDRIVKLSWKVDWAMRWNYEGVVFEPAGHDHASPGGSFDTCSKVIEEVFGRVPPILEEYKFVGLQGLGSKMSGSKGNVISPKELLEIYTPEMLKWLYASKSPAQSFELSFGKEIFRQYSEFDKVLERLRSDESSDPERRTVALSGITGVSEQPPIPFRQLVGLGQIVQWDLQKLKDILGNEYDNESINTRLQRAKTWVEKYNSEEAIRLFSELNTTYLQKMTLPQINAVQKLHDFLANHEHASITDLDLIVYEIPRKPEYTGEELKKAQRHFFKDVYNLLIGKDAGPRLSTFLWAADRTKLLSCLNVNPTARK